MIALIAQNCDITHFLDKSASKLEMILLEVVKLFTQTLLKS